MAKRKILKFLDPQLAKPWNQKAVEKLLKKHGHAELQQKIDGIRCQITLHPDDPTRLVAVSRKGIEILSLPHEILAQHFELGDTDTWNIDCEVNLEGMTFQVASGFFRSNDPLPDFLLGRLRFHTFDNWAHITFGKTDQVRRVSTVRVNSIAEINQWYDFWRKCGFEGIIVKDPTHPEVHGRKNGWWKMKPDDTIDGRIIAIHIGTGKYGHCMGSCTVLLENDKETEVGTGFTDELRELMFDNQGAYIGRYVEISFMEYTDDGNLRHPAFKAFRDLNYSKGNKL